MRISDWSSDVCSSDLIAEGDVIEADRPARRLGHRDRGGGRLDGAARLQEVEQPLGRAGGPLDVAHHLGKGADRKSVVWGKSVSVRVDLVGRGILKKKTTKNYSLICKISSNTIQ